MNLTLKFIALAFIAAFALAVWLVVGSYVGNLVPLSTDWEFKWWWALSGMAGSVAAAAIAAPFVVVLFERRRWLAALFVVIPLVVVNDTSNFSLIGALLVTSYFSMLMVGIWISSRVLESKSSLKHQSINRSTSG